MPPPIHQHGDTQSQSQSHPQPQPKQAPNLLSLILKPIIMLLLTSLFFLFLGFAAFLLLHLFLIGGAIHRFRSHPTAPGTSPSTAFRSRDLNKLPDFRVNRGSAPGTEARCVVCLEGFRNGQWCRKLAGCGHVFHRRCVDAWLVKVAACPTCRTPVRSNAQVPRDHDAQFWTCATHTNSLTTIL